MYVAEARRPGVDTVQTRTVEFTMDAVGKCQCIVCPVQADSSCAHELDKGVQSLLGPGAWGDPRHIEVPRVYCSTGGASCDDLDFDQACMCPKTCEVYRENKLHEWKYCQRGPASEIG